MELSSEDKKLLTKLKRSKDARIDWLYETRDRIVQLLRRKFEIQISLDYMLAGFNKALSEMKKTQSFKTCEEYSTIVRNISSLLNNILHPDEELKQCEPLITLQGYNDEELERIAKNLPEFVDVFGELTKLLDENLEKCSSLVDIRGKFKRAFADSIMALGNSYEATSLEYYREIVEDEIKRFEKVVNLANSSNWHEGYKIKYSKPKKEIEKNGETIESIMASPEKLTKVIEAFVNYQTYDRVIMRSKQKYAESIVAGIKEYLEYIQLLLDRASTATEQETSQSYLQKICFSWANHKRYTMPWPIDREHNEKIYDKKTMTTVVKEEMEQITVESLKNMLKSLETKGRDEKKIDAKLSSALSQLEGLVALLDNVQAKCAKANKATGEKLQKLLTELNVMLDEFTGLKRDQGVEIK